MQHNSLCAIVLAAGKGTRMRSDRAKVLHHVHGLPMIEHVIRAVLPLEPGRLLAVVGHQADAVRALLQRYPVDTVFQNEQLGTGHAVRVAEAGLAGFQGTVVIVCGDVPLILPETLAAMLQQHRDSGAALTVLTTRVENPAGYGRIVSDAGGGIQAIVEEKDASEEVRRTNEINGGIYCADSGFLFDALGRLGRDNAQKEYYLTDIVVMARAGGGAARRFFHADAVEVLGVNSRVELSQANAVIKRRRNRELMVSGVTLVDPETVFVDLDAFLGPDTVIHPHVHIRGASVIGRGCEIHPFSLLDTARLVDGCVLPPYSHITSSDGKRP